MPTQEAEPAETPPQADDDAGDDPLRGGPEALGRLERQFEELVEYLRLYLAARQDALRAALRRWALWLVAFAAGLAVLGLAVGHRHPRRGTDASPPTPASEGARAS